jgi:hypothetical protein
MNLGTALLTTAQGQPLDHLDTFATSLDAVLVTQALEATGTASVRRRKLPAERAVWLMLGMALLRDRSIQAVCDHLHLVLPDHTGKSTISSAGLVQARDRLGIAPLEHLFNAVVARHRREQIDAHRWRGLAVLGIDATTIRVPDSDENRAHFTLPSSGAHCESAYPQARVVGLMALGAHFLLDLKVGAYAKTFRLGDALVKCGAARVDGTVMNGARVTAIGTPGTDSARKSVLNATMVNVKAI